MRTLGALMILACFLCATSAAANTLTAVFNGPIAAHAVSSGNAGAQGKGHMLLDFTLTASGGSWSVTELTFSALASATAGDHDAGLEEVRLYQSTSGGEWDANTVIEAAHATGFSGGSLTFVLHSSAFNSTTSRRFFVTAITSTSARADQYFGAGLQALQAAPDQPGGTIVGVPIDAVPALVIDASILVAMRGPNLTAGVLRHNAGSAQRYVAGELAMLAFNDDIQVGGLHLSDAGNTSWAPGAQTDVELEVYLDNGDGEFNETEDELLYRGTSLTTLFSNPVVVPNHEQRSIWICLSVSANAGMGVTGTFMTYSLYLDSPADLASSAQIILISNAAPPVFRQLSLIEFRVDSFEPLRALHGTQVLVTMRGSGFMQPFYVRIADSMAFDSVSFMENGTRVDALTRGDLPVGLHDITVFSTGFQIQLPYQFEVLAVDLGGGDNGSGGGGGGGDNGGNGGGSGNSSDKEGCVAMSPQTLHSKGVLAGLAFLAGILAFRRRALRAE
jgi:hypothetical protein